MEAISAGHAANFNNPGETTEAVVAFGGLTWDNITNF